jgi:hypothetical protein
MDAEQRIDAMIAGDALIALHEKLTAIRSSEAVNSHAELQQKYAEAVALVEAAQEWRRTREFEYEDVGRDPADTKLKQVVDEYNHPELYRRRACQG